MKTLVLFLAVMLVGCSDSETKNNANNENNQNNENNSNNTNVLNNKSVTFRLVNNSGEPVFASDRVGKRSDCALGNVWLDINDGEASYQLSPPCGPCESCNAICAEPNIDTQQLAAGATREYRWDGIVTEVDPDDATCWIRTAPTGDLVAEFCWAHRLDENEGFTDAECQEIPFELDDGEVVVTIEPTARPQLTIELHNTTDDPIWAATEAIRNECETNAWVAVSDSDENSIMTQGCTTCDCSGDLARMCPQCGLDCPLLDVAQLQIEPGETRSFVWDRTRIGNNVMEGACSDRKLLAGEYIASFCWSTTLPADPTAFQNETCTDVPFDPWAEDLLSFDVE